jgi:MFS family permease
VSPTFRALRYRNYRLWSSGAIVSNTGTWMQRVAQDWLVLTVLTATSGVAVGITTGLQFAPVLLLAPLAGAVADRWSKRYVLVATQTASGVLALVLGLLVVLGVARLWEVYVLAGLLGVVAAFDGPARQTFVSEMVPREDLPNAVGLNSASFNAGRLIGPGIAGLLIHWLGTGPVFLINAASFGAVVASLLRMRAAELRPAPRSARGRGAVRAGLAYVRGRPDLVLILTVVGLIGTFGLNFQLTTALMARMEFHQGSGQYGLLGSVMAVGSLAGALLAARRERPGIGLVLAATAAFGVSSVLAALAPTYLWFAVALVPVGLSSLTLMTAANATVQLSSAPQLRGRVMALYMAIFMGGTPLGAPLVGWVGQTFGARWTILLGGLVALATAGGAALWWMRIDAAGLAPEPESSKAGSPQPGGVAQELVPDEGDQVDQGVRDDQRHHPATAPEPLGEHQAHDGIADERSEALIHMVSAAQHGADRQPGPGRGAELFEPGQQVPDDHDLLQHRVLDRLQHEHRHGPPVGVEGRRDDLRSEPVVPPQDVEGEAGQSDQRREQGAHGQVVQRSAPVEAEPAGGAPTRL